MAGWARTNTMCVRCVWSDGSDFCSRLKQNMVLFVPSIMAHGFVSVCVCVVVRLAEAASATPIVYYHRIEYVL